jgi:hypothetical protein
MFALSTREWGPMCNGLAPPNCHRRGRVPSWQRAERLDYPSGSGVACARDCMGAPLRALMTIANPGTVPSCAAPEPWSS